MLKKKTNYEVKTKTKCLEDTATGQAGAVAYHTFKGEDVELSNAYHIPYHAICSVKVKTTTEEVEYDDPACMGETPTPPTPVVPYFDGVHNASIHQGTEFSLTDGVKAYDGAGNEIPFTVEPSEIDICEVGQHHFTYTAEGVTATRTITVSAIANPTISGIETLVVEVNEEFDPLDGVSAVDGNGNDLEVTYEPVSPYPFTLLTSGASGNLVIGEYDSATSESPATFVYEMQEGESYALKVTLEDFVENGSEPQTFTGIGSAAVANGIRWVTFDIGSLYTEIPNDNSIPVINEGDRNYTMSWSSLVVEVVGEQQ